MAYINAPINMLYHDPNIVNFRSIEEALIKRNLGSIIDSSNNPLQFREKVGSEIQYDYVLVNRRQDIGKSPEDDRIVQSLYKATILSNQNPIFVVLDYVCREGEENFFSKRPYGSYQIPTLTISNWDPRYVLEQIIDIESYDNLGELDRLFKVQE